MRWTVGGHWLRQVPEIFLDREAVAFSFGKVPENSCLSRGPEASDYIETCLFRRESGMRGDELMSVPIGDVLGVMAIFINAIVLLLIELIKAQKK